MWCPSDDNARIRAMRQRELRNRLPQDPAKRLQRLREAEAESIARAEANPSIITRIAAQAATKRRIEAEERLIAESDPVQREALAAQDREQQQALARMWDHVSGNRIRRALGLDREDEKRRKARALNFLRSLAGIALVVSRQEHEQAARAALATSFRELTKPPPRLPDVASLIHAPRPGPSCGVPVAA